MTEEVLELHVEGLIANGEQLPSREVYAHVSSPGLTSALKRETRKAFAACEIIIISAFCLLAVPSSSVSGTRHTEPSIEEVLTTDPLLLNFDETIAMVERREAILATETASSNRKALGLLEIGELESQLADATVHAANGGVNHVCKSFKTLREATKILESAGSGLELPLLDARLRYAEVMAFGFCDGGPDCEILSTLAADLAQKALATAKSRGNAELTARALRGLAQVYLGLQQRDLEMGHLNYSMASMSMLIPCSTCPSAQRLPLPELEPWTARRQALLEEAIRVEAAEGVWTRGLIESLVSLAFLHQEGEQQADLVKSIAGAAANGSAALRLTKRDRIIGNIADVYLRMPPRSLGLIPFDAHMVGSKLADLVRVQSIQSGMDFVLLSRISATIGEPWATRLLNDFLATSDRAERPAISPRDLLVLGKLSNSAQTANPEKPPSCDPVHLRSAAMDQLHSERHVFQVALQTMNEIEFRWMMSGLPSEDRLFHEARRCNVQDESVLQPIVESLLLRREIWIYRLSLLNRARESGQPGIGAKAAELRELRRQRAEQRLQRVAMPAATEVRWPGCREDWPASGELSVYLKTEKKIFELEQELTSEMNQDATLARDFDATLARHLDTLWSDLLSSLGSDAVLVGYVPVVAGEGRRILAFVVDGSGHISSADVGMETHIEFFSLSVLSGHVGDILRPAGETLVDPIEKRLQGKRRALLLASGPVRLLPWSAFKDRKGQYLGRRFSVSWLQRSRDAGLIDDSSDPTSGVTFIAPQYEAARDTDRPWPRIVEPKFSPLPGAVQEISALTQLLEARHIKTEAFSGSAATENAVRQIANPAVLHIAAHGFRIKSPDPLAGDDIETERSGRVAEGLDYLPGMKKSDLEPSLTKVGVALAGANRLGQPAEGDGLLTASEASELDLRNTRLVVLSGCETGFPTLQDAGGAYDLALGFRMAGAKAAVASLWKAEDDATRFLMEQLYKGLLEGLPVAEALWRAKDVLRKSPEFSDPRSWAPFEVFGANITVWPRRDSAHPRVPPRSAGPAATERTILSDSFEDNRHSWRASDHPSAPALIRNGHYILGSTAGGWRYATIDVDLPERSDFDISCTVTKLRGTDQFFFGLLWGFRDQNNFYNFAITGDGRAAVTSKVSGIFSNYNEPDLPCSAVHLSNATNALRVVKRGARMRFFLNGIEVHSMDWQSNFGFAPKLGFLAYGELLLAFDDLKVSIPNSPK